MKQVPRVLRMRAFQAFAATAILAGAVAATVPAVTASASPQAPAVSTCATSALRVWLGIPGDATAGPVYYQLEISNVSSHACTLFGYPGVSAVAAGGGQLGSPARRDSGDPEHLVTLVRGATAHVFLGVVDPGFFSPAACHPAKAIGLRVYPPNDTTSTIVDWPFPACAKRGPIFLSVRVTVAGTGIPGYSS